MTIRTVVAEPPTIQGGLAITMIVVNCTNPDSSKSNNGNEQHYGIAAQ